MGNLTFKYGGREHVLRRDPGDSAGYIGACPACGRDNRLDTRTHPILILAGLITVPRPLACGYDGCSWRVFIMQGIARDRGSA